MRTTATGLSKADGALTGLALLAFFFCFYQLSYPDLQMWDEADNAGVILETLESGSPLQLRRLGEPCRPRTFLATLINTVLSRWWFDVGS